MSGVWNANESSILSTSTMKSQYPKTTRELLDFLKAKQNKKDQKTLDLVAGIERAVEQIAKEKKDPTSLWPKQYMRLEYNGVQVKSVVVFYCAHCRVGGVAASQVESGEYVQCWHCDLCNDHCDFRMLAV